MAKDGTNDGAGPAPIDDARVTMATMELRYVEEVIDFILWDTPTSMIPTHARVWEIAAELASRSDVADPIVQAALTECWKFLGFDSTTCH